MFELCSFKWLRGKATCVSAWTAEKAASYTATSEIPSKGMEPVTTRHALCPLFLTTEALTASVCGSCARRRPPPIIEIRSRGP